MLKMAAVTLTIIITLLSAGCSSIGIDASGGSSGSTTLGISTGVVL